VFRVFFLSSTFQGKPREMALSVHIIGVSHIRHLKQYAEQDPHKDAQFGRRYADVAWFSDPAMALRDLDRPSLAHQFAQNPRGLVFLHIADNMLDSPQAHQVYLAGSVVSWALYALSVDKARIVAITQALPRLTPRHVSPARY